MCPCRDHRHFPARNRQPTVGFPSTADVVLPRPVPPPPGLGPELPKPSRARGTVRAHPTWPKPGWALPLVTIKSRHISLAATVVSITAGRHGDRHGATRALAAGAASFAAGYLWFAAGPRQPLALLPTFVLAGIGIGCAETAEHAAVAACTPPDLRGSAFGLLAGIQAAGNLAASTLAGVLRTALSPTAAFVFLAAAMGIAVPLIAASRPLAGRSPSGS